MIGPAQNSNVSATAVSAAASVMCRQRARAAAISAGATEASSTNPPSGARTTKVNGRTAVSAAPARARSVTRTSEVGRTNVSLKPGAPCSVPSACSTTVVAGRAPDLDTGSMRTSRGPSAPGAMNSVAGPSTRSLGRSETRPAHASGSPASS